VGLALTASVAAQDKPNFLIIWGDDIGICNISAYNDGAMGYRTPNIDRIAAEGIRFTDYYGDQSCTAGRSSFITGQGPYNDTMMAHDDTVGELLKKLDELGIAENTIVLYTTDNGPHFNA
jgi:arylsulfatase